MHKKTLVAMLGFLVLMATAACSAFEPPAPLTLDVSFLTTEQQTQWTQIQEKNPGLVSYVAKETENSIIAGYPATRISNIRRAIQAVEMSQSDQDTMLAVMACSSAMRNPFMGEVLARDIAGSPMRDIALIRVVDGYADMNTGRNDALRVLDMIQGNSAKDAAYASLAKR